ncbi:conserved Plasmodium protein, unknown function [Plasmodium ovale]|uniref:Uncharacterized protein n=1 Tax=Plasmodium ovale TaxID=36330 RepID=A0A1C3L4F0_PLAOA|nr:conserved Plasmodium protein, unknown function [Plasmodium ovale]
MSKYRGSLFTALISTTLGWNLNRLYRKNELNFRGLKNNHDIIVVRQVNISDTKETGGNHISDGNKVSIGDEKNAFVLSEKELLNFVQSFSDINRKHKGFCETNIFKNSTFSSSNNEHNSDDSFNTYIIIDKWKNKMNFEQSKKEFVNLFSQKKDMYNKKMEHVYFKYEIYDNNYETTSAKNIIQKLLNLIFE